MKIVIVNQPQDSVAAAEEQRGSVAIVNWELARQLARSHKVIVYAPLLPGQALTEEWGGIEIRRVKWVAKRFHKGMQLLVGRAIPHGQYFNSRLYFREYYSQLIRDLRRQSPDVVHLPQQLQFVPMLRGKLPKTKIVVHMHQDELASLDHAPLQERLKSLDAVVTVSDYVTVRARARFPEFANRIHTIGNGVDVDRFRPGEDRPTNGVIRLLFVGRISPDKGVHLLIDAFNTLALERSDVHLTIVGKAGMLPFDILRLLLTDGPALDGLREFYGRSLSDWLAHEVFGQKTSYLDVLHKRLSPQVARRVRFTGSISMQELIRTYQESDLLVLPSIWQESYGLPIAEAMASGTAVLASCCGGVPELIDDGVTGVLIPQCNLNALTTALRTLTGDRPALRRMGLAARDKAESLLTWTRSAARLQNVYRGLVEQEAPAGIRRSEAGLSTKTSASRWLASLKQALRVRT